MVVFLPYVGIYLAVQALAWSAALYADQRARNRDVHKGLKKDGKTAMEDGKTAMEDEETAMENEETAKEGEETAMETLRRLGHGKLKLNEYEKRIASEVIHPDDIDVRLTDIGGQEDIISSLRESVIISLLHPGLFRSTSTLLTAPKGVLLYGPPGCGKTMLAKALAKESGATFINITASVLMNKWFGESNKLVAGLFSLARKMQPSIIFMDEIDSFLRERREHDHEVTASMKAEFMTLWDGLLSGNDRILILGATNRLRDIDPAFLRRMPKQFPLSLPDTAQREKILTLILKDVPLAPNFPMRALAEYSRGKSGSDLKELCRNAAMLPVRELVRQANGDVALLARIQDEGLERRPLTIGDFIGPDGVRPAIMLLGQETTLAILAVALLIASLACLSWPRLPALFGFLISLPIIFSLSLKFLSSFLVHRHTSIVDVNRYSPEPRLPGYL
ncbi:P-loop containing nucleoside triphosphate hydrolase protein [Lactarius psammicola]|nr:P-loop containing nucleoside triphosphate hydrolase protein [Lactarius psammicola]